MKWQVALCVALIGGQALASASKFTNQTSTATVHEEGDAHWTESLERQTSPMCSDKSVTAVLLTGRQAEIRKDSTDCVRNSVVVRNDSTRPLDCHVFVEQETPDESGETLRESDLIIDPGSTLGGADSYARANPSPKSFGSKCWVIPPPPLDRLKIPDECRITMRGPSEDFYPPGSIRRGETGDVIIEFSIVAGSSKLHNAHVVASSGFVDLDYAALKKSRYMSLSGGCPGQPQRFITRFRLRDDAPPPLPEAPVGGDLNR